MDPNPIDPPPLRALPTLDQVHAWLAQVFQSNDRMHRLSSMAGKICKDLGIPNETLDVIQEAYQKVRDKLCEGKVTYRGQGELVNLLHDNCKYTAQDRARRLRRTISTPVEDLDQHPKCLHTESDYHSAREQILAASRRLPTAGRDSVETELANETLPASSQKPPRNHRSNLKTAQRVLRDKDFPTA